MTGPVFVRTGTQWVNIARLLTLWVESDNRDAGKFSVLGRATGGRVIHLVGGFDTIEAAEHHIEELTAKTARLAQGVTV